MDKVSKLFFIFKLMTKDDCKFNFEWDYSQWGNTKLDLALYTQRVWNQTLITKINQISANIHKASLRGGGNKIIVPKKLEPLFDTLEFYWGNSLSGRYAVEFKDDLCFKFGVKYPEDVIYIFNSEVKSNRILVPKITEATEATEEQMEQFSFRFPQSEEELTEYKKRLCGSVTVLNYE